MSKQDSFDDFAIQGMEVKAQIKKKPDETADIQEFFENRVLKPLPDYSYNPELKELAQTI